MKKNILILGALCLSSTLCLFVACGHNKEAAPPLSKAALFKKAFLEERKINVVTNRGNTYYHIGLQRFDLDNVLVPPIPIFGTYDSPGSYVVFALALPEEFNENIPEEIHNELKKHRVRKVDLFLAVQNFIPGLHGTPGFEMRLRAHFWALPGPHAPDTNYSTTIKAGFYQFDHNIDAEIVSNQLVSMDLSIHPEKTPTEVFTKYSPPNAEVGLNDLTAASNSGWSLVLNKKTRSAAVTLHGIYEDSVNHPRLQAILAKHEHLQNVMDEMEGDPIFEGLLKKLKAVTK